MFMRPGLDCGHGEVTQTVQYDRIAAAVPHDFHALHAMRMMTEDYICARLHCVARDGGLILRQRPGNAVNAPVM